MPEPNCTGNSNVELFWNSEDSFDCLTRQEQCDLIGDSTQFLDFVPTGESEAQGGVADSAFAGRDAHSSSNRMQLESSKDESRRNCVGNQQFRRRSRTVSMAFRRG